MNRFLNILPWLLLLIVIGLYVYERNSGPKIPDPIKNTGPVNVDVPIVKTYTDSDGVKHAVVESGLNTVSQAYINSVNRQPNIIDSSAQKMQIAAKQIIELTRFNSLVKDSLLKARKTINSLNNRLAYVYNDKFVKLSFTPPIDSLDTGIFDFAYNADLTVVQYQKRKWFLGAKKSYLDISSNDPRTTIRGVKQLTIEQETPEFGLRFQGSTNWNPETNVFGFGPAIRVDLGRFSFQGNYIYYPSSGRWRPGVTANYDILRF